MKIDLKATPLFGSEHFNTCGLGLTKRRKLDRLRLGAPSARTAPTMARQRPESEPQRLVTHVLKVDLDKAPLGQITHVRKDLELHRSLNSRIITANGQGVAV